MTGARHPACPARPLQQLLTRRWLAMRPVRRRGWVAWSRGCRCLARRLIAIARSQICIEPTSPGPYVDFTLTSPGPYVVIVWQAQRHPRHPPVASPGIQAGLGGGTTAPPVEDTVALSTPPTVWSYLLAPHRRAMYSNPKYAPAAGRLTVDSALAALQLWPPSRLAARPPPPRPWPASLSASHSTPNNLDHREELAVCSACWPRGGVGGLQPVYDTVELLGGDGLALSGEGGRAKGGGGEAKRVGDEAKPTAHDANDGVELRSMKL